MLKCCSGGFGSHVTTSGLRIHLTGNRRHLHMHSNMGVWRCKLFSKVLMGWPVNTSRSLSLSYKCSRLFAFLWPVFIHLLSPSPPAGNRECCPAAGTDRTGLTSKPQSWSPWSQVPSPVLWKCWVGGKGFPSCGTPWSDSAQCIQEEGGGAAVPAWV